MDVIYMSGIPDFGDLGGTTVSRAVLDGFRADGDPFNHFGSTRDHLFETMRSFKSMVTDRARRISRESRRLFGEYQAESVAIEGLVDFEDFSTVPAAFHLPILQHEPIRKLFDQRKIDGFGYDHIPEGDPYPRLYNNGRVTDIDEVERDDDGFFYCENRYEEDDPRVSPEMLDAIMDTRITVERMLKTTLKDPTNYPQDRG